MTNGKILTLYTIVFGFSMAYLKSLFNAQKDLKVLKIVCVVPRKEGLLVWEYWDGILTYNKKEFHLKVCRHSMKLAEFSVKLRLNPKELRETLLKYMENHYGVGIQGLGIHTLELLHPRYLILNFPETYPPVSSLGRQMSLLSNRLKGRLFGKTKSSKRSYVE